MDYPLLRKREEIFLDKKEEIELIEVLENIKLILENNLPPEVINKNFCKKCSYYELCYI